MFFKRIKRRLKKLKKEKALLAFEIAHFLIDVVIVIHVTIVPILEMFRSTKL